MARDRQILLVEDDMIQTMLFRAAVDGVIGTVTSFTSSSEAFAIMRSSYFDLCVVDLGIFTRPGVFDEDGGTRFVSAIRRSVSLTIPVIVATSGRHPAALVTCFRSGADDYVLKDEGLDKLLSRVRLWVRQLPQTQRDLEAKRTKVIEFLEKAAANGLELPE